MRYQFVECNLDQVLGYFAKDFKAPEGERIEGLREYFIDTAKRAVIFKLRVVPDEKAPPPAPSQANPAEAQRPQTKRRAKAKRK